MKALVIEDNKDTVQGILDYFEDNGWESLLCGFSDARQKVLSFRPELIVMDWMYDAENTDAGKSIFDDIYEFCFVPTIVFSALAKTINLDEVAPCNPLIEVYEKGDESVVIERIKEWAPYIEPVSGLKMELNQSLLASSRVIEYFIKLKTEEPGVIKYMLNKRASLCFDDDFIATENGLPQWASYEYPPSKKDLHVSDILRKCSPEMNVNEPGQATDYYVVLTPSCDMARLDKESDKRILIAHCEEPSLLIGKASISSNEDKALKSLSNIFHTGYFNSLVPMPALPQVIPPLVLNLKDISIVKHNLIGKNEKDIEGKDFYRVSSMISPYREQIVWAHLIDSCRPGLLDRDVIAWGKEMLGK